jgi:hypothetical protein
MIDGVGRNPAVGPPIAIVCAALFAACTGRPPCEAIAWRDDAWTLGPATVRDSAANGYLKVETIRI